MAAEFKKVALSGFGRGRSGKAYCPGTLSQLRCREAQGPCLGAAGRARNGGFCEWASGRAPGWLTGCWGSCALNLFYFQVISPGESMVTVGGPRVSQNLCSACQRWLLDVAFWGIGSLWSIAAAVQVCGVFVVSLSVFLPLWKCLNDPNHSPVFFVSCVYFSFVEEINHLWVLRVETCENVPLSEHQ